MKIKLWKKFSNAIRQLTLISEDSCCESCGSVRINKQENSVDPGHVQLRMECLSCGYVKIKSRDFPIPGPDEFCSMH